MLADPESLQQLGTLAGRRDIPMNATEFKEVALALIGSGFSRIPGHAWLKVTR